MNNKFLLTIIATLLVGSFAVFSQTTEEDLENTNNDSIPRKKFAVAATLGYNSYTNVRNPNVTHLASRYRAWSNSGLYIGVEGGYFLSVDMKLTFELGFNHTYNPGYLSVPGTGSGNLQQGDIPSYKAVANQSNTTYRFVFGANKYSKIARNLSLYYGGTLGLSHGFSSYKIPDADSNLGVSAGESLTTNIAGVAGIEYSLPNSPLYFAIQTNALNYSYNVTSVKPVPGVAPLKADAHGFSFIGYPSLRLGFTF